MPAGIALEPVSRTVGAERIVDEMIVTMTHDRGLPVHGIEVTQRLRSLAVGAAG
ncbi:MAG: hypothetical protein ACRDSF_21345 [Pseudonocardiaceae bacterium]